MELLEGVITLAFVTIALVSLPDQCEATTCYACPGSGDCPDTTASTKDCDGELPCLSFWIKKPGEDDSMERGCNPAGGSTCFADTLGLGLVEGCKLQRGHRRND